MEGVRVRHWQLSSALALSGAAMGVQACAPDAVRWEPARRSAAGDMEQAAGAAVTPWAPRTTPSELICAGALVAARARGDTAFAAWWMPRRDSSSALVVARSDDGGGAWRAPIAADSTDHA